MHLSAATPTEFNSQADIENVLIKTFVLEENLFTLVGLTFLLISTSGGSLVSISLAFVGTSAEAMLNLRF